MLKSDLDRGRTYAHFEDLLNPSVYEPLPDEWLVGMTDVIDSAGAIDRGRYEEVNFAGASIIAALGNLRGDFEFPFVFGGDGASFALPVADAETAIHALRQVCTYSKTKLGLPMRAGLAAVGTIRKSGRDVRLARYAVSENASYAMFAGGGLKWFEKEVKSGRFRVDSNRHGGGLPDLNGLACEWDPFESVNGKIVSLLVEPVDNAPAPDFETVTRRVMDVVGSIAASSSPVPKKLHTRRAADEIVVDQTTWDDIASNSDFRKFDDLLRLTVDCTPEQIDEIEGILKEASDAGLVRYGMYCQSHAIMTCLVPSANSSAHLHFLDGMGGGYAKAAAMLKAVA